MTEISFWSYVKNDDSAEIIVQNLELLMQTFYNKDEYEVIIINPALGESALSTINGFEREHSQNVMLVNCDGIMQDEAFDVMLEYANGQCFMQIDEGFELNSKTFEKLLYDAAICDEDTFKYIRDKYTYIALGRDSSEYLSSLHALEHFGLGRYGDPVDFEGWRKALKQYIRVLKPSGNLILSVPVGRTQRVCFNAHRVFRPMTIVDEVGVAMNLMEFTVIHNAKTTTMDFSNNGSRERISEAIDFITDNTMGEYDCGIFVFKRAEA